MQIFHALYVLCLLATSALSQLDLNDINAPLDIWPPGPGQLLEPQVPNAELTDILNSIDTSRIQSDIQTLTTFGTRHTLSNQTDPVRGIGAARDWIASQFQAIAATSNGRMTVTVQPFLQQPTSSIPNATIITNVFATLTGSKEPNRAYVVSGHYDSRVTNIMDFTDDAPGADDDASGVAVSLELARVMATHDSAATLIFATVAGEEQCLCGSAFMAAQLKQDGVDVQGMLDNDIVGSSTADDGTIDKFDVRMFVQGIPLATDTPAQISVLGTIGGENDSPSHQLGRFVSEVSQNAVTQMNVRTIYRPDRFLRGGDHLSFLDQGFPAIRFTEPHENFAHQHQNTRVIGGVQFGDLIEFVDMDFVTRVAKVNGAALWSLGQAPGTPKNAFLDTSILTNNSTLTWTQDPNADAGYEIVWRQTDEPIWSRIIPVGLTNSTTVQLSKDNVQMGIRAVGSNGFKSPAAFPLP